MVYLVDFGHVHINIKASTVISLPFYMQAQFFSAKEKAVFASVQNYTIVKGFIILKV